ncbi:exonuclease SbcCD subunit D C-terminal domain-containing protein [Croceibacterium sp. TMG7-5b_MA50]|uniref:exonuclease SbcCD subunit D C-terminal domain-containing protein n=1 Tax=Croceibacterium sp. TMG7-5b_MA50 TaxID=3121290 RepID=UPI0032218D26
MITPVRLLHTSDWHLGHELMGHGRGAEHDAFLAWLLDTLEEARADCLLVTGDIYDVANPPVAAMQRLFRFVAQARARCPRLQIVMIGGNHDSALKIDLPGALVDERVRFVGALPRTLSAPDRRPDCERICLPLANADGETAAWLAAVPFCRPGDLGPGGLPQLYAKIAADAVTRARGLPLVLSGHLHVVEGAVSELSERRIHVGGEEAQATSLFGADAAYVALGHLHRPQTIAGPGAAPIRYAGSPFPLSATERDYRHSVTLVTLHPAGAEIEELPIPRPVPFLKVPAGAAAAPLDAVIAELLALDIVAGDPETQPFLEVAVLVDGPEPRLQADVLAALQGKPVRLTRIHRLARNDSGPAALAAREQELADLTPEAVFAELHRRTHGGEPADALARAFAALVADAHGGVDA